MKKLLIGSLFTLIAGCGSGGGGDSSEGSSGSIDSSFVGLWDQTADYGIDGVDESYFDIGSNGYATVYDYYGDTFDQGENCYYIVPDAFLFERSGSNYTMTQIYADASMRISMAIEDNVLAFTALEDSAVFDFEKGEKGSIGTKTSGLSVTDFQNAECE